MCSSIDCGYVSVICVLLVSGFHCSFHRSTSSTKPIKERRAFSTESIQQQQKQKYSAVLALRDAVRAERETMSQSVEVSVLSEKAASILGIAPPRHYKRASMYAPLMERRLGESSDTHPGPPSMPPRSNSYHPGLKRGKAFDRVVSLSHRISIMSPLHHCFSCSIGLNYVYTVGPPNKGHFGANRFVPCREVVPISEVK